MYGVCRQFFWSETCKCHFMLCAALQQPEEPRVSQAWRLLAWCCTDWLAALVMVQHITAAGDQIEETDV